MLLGQYIKRNMPDAVELNDMISRPGEGYAISQMAVAPVDTGALRMHIQGVCKWTRWSIFGGTPSALPSGARAFCAACS